MKKYAILGLVSTALALCATADNLRAARVAHRLTDEQILEVVKKAPTGASVTVPADFFRDVIAGKYRWQNATNWIALAAGDDTMVKALESMDADRLAAIQAKLDALSHTNSLERRIISLTNSVARIRLECEEKIAIQTNITANVKKELRKTVEDLLGTRTREKDAVQKFYEFRDLYQQYFDKFKDLDAKWSAAKGDIVAKRKEVQEKYDDATFITKPIYKFFLDIIDKILEDFNAEPVTEADVDHALNTVVETE